MKASRKVIAATDYAAIREHIRRAHVGRAVALSEILANAIVSLSGSVKRFFSGAASANNPALRGR
jgi:hypothetical protein